jgi:N-acetylglutamate synthase-like GNAT family acetyltransferase
MQLLLYFWATNTFTYLLLSHMDIRIFDTSAPEYKEMIELRLNVLLRPLGVPASYINSEKEKADLMIGAFDQGVIIGCCVLTPLEREVMQLRQMAVRLDVQGKGVGAAILAFAEKTAKERGFMRLMMHARDVVIPFYQKCGYRIAGDQFTEVGIAHHRMEKELT